MKVAIPQATKDGYIECCDGGVADLSYPSSATRRGRVQGGGNICPTITAQSNELSRIEVEEHTVRVRKLTPKECWRLMGFDDDSFERAAKVCSNSQLYKQAGNSIVVDVLMAIFKEMI
jgi:DNA (cytosine-5)-methyltransferase 1